MIRPALCMCGSTYVSKYGRDGGQQKKKKKRSGRVDGLIRDVQVRPSHFECAAEGEKSASDCAGLLLKSSHHPHMTTVKCMHQQPADLRQTQR